MEKLNSKQIKEICKLQHKMVVAKIMIKNMPVAYTNDTIYQMEKDLKIRAIGEECGTKMAELINKYGNEIIENTFSDKEYLQKDENKFTFGEQKQATKEVIGKELTLEEVIEKYGDN